MKIGIKKQFRKVTVKFLAAVDDAPQVFLNRIMITGIALFFLIPLVIIMRLQGYTIAFQLFSVVLGISIFDIGRMLYYIWTGNWKCIKGVCISRGKSLLRRHIEILFVDKSEEGEEQVFSLLITKHTKFDKGDVITVYIPDTKLYKRSGVYYIDAVLYKTCKKIC